MTFAQDEFKKRLADGIFGKGSSDAIVKGKCPACKNPIGKFRDALSEKEYKISKLCQGCQDEVFGVTDNYPGQIKGVK